MNVSYNRHRNYWAKVKGTGKLGDFSGEMIVNCAPTDDWEWTSIDRNLYLDERAVPTTQALVSLSAYICRDE